MLTATSAQQRRLSFLFFKLVNAIPISEFRRPNLNRIWQKMYTETVMTESWSPPGGRRLYKNKSRIPKTTMIFCCFSLFVFFFLIKFIYVEFLIIWSSSCCSSTRWQSYSHQQVWYLSRNMKMKLRLRSNSVSIVSNSSAPLQWYKTSYVEPFNNLTLATHKLMCDIWRVALFLIVSSFRTRKSYFCSQQRPF